jgi:hypothetical protein
VCSPESTLLWAGDVLRSVGLGMMMPVIGYPTCRGSGAVENREEDQHVLDELVHLQGAMREQAVVANGRAEPTKRRNQKRQAKNLQAGKRKQNQTNHAQNVDQYDECKNAGFGGEGFPEGPFPRRSLARGVLVGFDFCC